MLSTITGERGWRYATIIGERVWRYTCKCCYEYYYLPTGVHSSHYNSQLHCTKTENEHNCTQRLCMLTVRGHAHTTKFF